MRAGRIPARSARISCEPNGRGRPVRVVQVSDADPRVVLAALRAALDGSGPAVGLAPTAVGLGGRAVGPSPTASALQEIGAPAPVPARAEVPEGTAVLIATSGSTGMPKQVVIGRAALVAGARATAARIGAGRWLLALPAGYVAGIQVLTRSLVHGEEPVLLDARFGPESFTVGARRLAGSRAYTSLVPAQLVTLLEDADASAALRSFEAVLIGGQAMPAALVDRARAAGVRIVRTYGATETSGGCVYDGVPLEGVTVRVRDGEVQVGGPTLADGYLADPALTDAAFLRDPDGTRWYRTGDAGSLECGVLRVHGRLDNVIVTGGINVSLDRVEQLVRAVPGLYSAVVVGVVDPRWGEASVVVVARDAGQQPGDPQLLEQARAAVAAGIGAHARPQRLVLVDELPLLASGKPDRAAIRRAIAAR